MLCETKSVKRVLELAECLWFARALDAKPILQNAAHAESYLLAAKVVCPRKPPDSLLVRGSPRSGSRPSEQRAENQAGLLLPSAVD